MAKLESKLDQPDDWLYDRSVLGWVLNPSLSKQLPFLYRIFSLYCKLYFGLTGKSYLKGGRELFRFLSNIFYRLSPDQYLELKLAGESRENYLGFSQIFFIDFRQINI